MRKIIGIVGGVGPYAGLDVNRKIFDRTRALKDQDHANVLLFSLAERIADRTAYITDPDTAVNPGEAIAKICEMISQSGAEVIGIPCNTAHAPMIMQTVTDYIAEKKLPVTLVHMIEATFDYIRQAYPAFTKVGLLSTLGTVRSKLYHGFAEKNGFQLITPDESGCEAVHDAIYNTAFGIKAFSNPVKPEAYDVMADYAERLSAEGAQAVILGCTEIPLAFAGLPSSDLILIDPTDILARALLAAAGYPLKE